jgi:hypothetical protein
MGLIANVYRSGRLVLEAPHTMTFQDCTINGWSVNFDRVCVVNADGPFEPDEKHPAVLLVKHRSLAGAVHAVLEAHAHANKWTMAGGNYLASSDSRFWELCEKLAQAASTARCPSTTESRGDMRNRIAAAVLAARAGGRTLGTAYTVAAERLHLERSVVVTEYLSMKGYGHAYPRRHSRTVTRPWPGLATRPSGG